jgi:ribosomal protein S18 acetylase RimI-like enzyme
MSISVRSATMTDIPLLAEFQRRLAIESENVTLDIATVTRGMQALFEDPSKGSYFIAEVDGVVAGCHMITYEWSDWRNGIVYWLQSVYVKEEFRKAGVFRKMFDVLKERIENDPAARGLRLYVDRTNTRAQKVYQAMGMNGDHYAVFEMMKGS